MNSEKAVAWITRLDSAFRLWWDLAEMRSSLNDIYYYFSEDGVPRMLQDSLARLEQGLKSADEYVNTDFEVYARGLTEQIAKERGFELEWKRRGAGK